MTMTTTTEMTSAPAPLAFMRPVTETLIRLADLFAWPLESSHYLDLVNPLWSARSLKARVESVEDETHESRTLTLLPGRGFRPHRAGQHIRVGLFVGGKHLVRTYSISSAPERTDGRITITVKGVEGGRASKELSSRIKPGMVLEIGPPQGNFVLPEAMPVKPLFITGGSGITPVMSMLRSLEARGALSDVVHIHHAPRRGDVIFGAELARLSNQRPGYRLHVIETREPGRDRHVSSDGLRALCPDLAQRETFVCGPPSLLSAVEAHWASEGMSGRLHVERFRAPHASTPSDAVGGLVRFARSGAAREADGETNLLRAAEDAGLNPAHGCRMGICHSCDVPLLSGCVRDLRSNRLIKEAGTKIQLCVSAAAGPVELDL